MIHIVRNGLLYIVLSNNEKYLIIIENDMTNIRTKMFKASVRNDWCFLYVPK
nr:MAG TPA: hypothetical protein [Caudoviricetes sp.]